MAAEKSMSMNPTHVCTGRFTISINMPMLPGERSGADLDCGGSDLFTWIASSEIILSKVRDKVRDKQ